MASILLAIIYLSFISLGIPDSLLGATWPTLYSYFNVPISYAGILQILISSCTVISSLNSDRLTKKFGTGALTNISVFITAIALFGFSISNTIFQLILWSIPFGLGAGSIDAALNNYVSLNYKSRHMSWLHSMWGIGATIGPLIMSYALTNKGGWQSGYRSVAYIQIGLTLILLATLSLWKNSDNNIKKLKKTKKALSLKETIKTPGAKNAMLVFFCYGSIEHTTALWAATYLVINRGINNETAASFTGIFFFGITIGRFISGFLTFKLNDNQMIKLGMFIISIGLFLLYLPINSLAYISLIIIGFGCSPIFPSLLHATPSTFKKEKSQAIIGLQMASAYVASSLMPPLFGIIANNINISLFPVFLTIALTIMIIMYKSLLNKTN